MTADLDDRIPEILRRVTVQELLATRGHEPAKSGPLSDAYLCPLAGHNDHRPSFVVRGNRWRCWSQCDRGGDVVDLVEVLEGCSRREAIELLAARAGIERESPAPRQRASRPSLSPDRAAALLRRFVDGRGWDHDAAREMRLHVVLDAAGKPRVRFPFVYGDEVVWFQDRALGDAVPKWLSPTGKRPALFNANALRLARERDGELFIVEGPSDVLALVSTYGSPAVVGIPGGGNFARDWVPAFSGLRQVVIVGDNDAAGEKFRQRVASMLSPVVERVVQLYVPEPHNDLDDWRRACGTDQPERFGEALLGAVAAAEAMGVAA